MFILNRDLSKARQVEIAWEDSPPSRVVNSWTLTGDDLKAVNGFDAPQRVKPQEFQKPAVNGGKVNVELPARSFTVLTWSAS